MQKGSVAHTRAAATLVAELSRKEATSGLLRKLLDRASTAARQGGWSPVGEDGAWAGEGPAVGLSRAGSQEREHCCDRIVVTRTGGDGYAGRSSRSPARACSGHDPAWPESPGSPHPHILEPEDLSMSLPARPRLIAALVLIPALLIGSGRPPARVTEAAEVAGDASEQCRSGPDSGPHHRRGCEVG